MRELCVVPEPEAAGHQDGGGDEARADTRTSAAAASATSLPSGSSRSRADFDIPKIIAEKIRSKSFFWSAELIPGTSPHLQALLEQSLKDIANHAHNAPSFVSVTWHESHLKEIKVGGSTRLQHPALELSKYLQQRFGIPALLHLSAGNLKQTQVVRILEGCIDSGITNILALRGDQVRDVEAEFHQASDLVHFIRKVFGSKFKIGVAGYPTGHPEAISLEQDLLYLKKKVDEGADFILTQMISSVDEFYTYLKRCDNLGVKVPIIPGLYLMQSFDSFKKFISTCHISVPARMYQDFKKIQDINKEKQYGLLLFQDLIKGLQKTSYCLGIHIFTLNRVSSVLKCLSHEELNSGIL